MHDLLDAIAMLFDILLTPFTQGSEPRKNWMKIVGTLIAVTGVVCVAGVILWTLYLH